MKLTYFQGAVPNFGDELNATMWGHLLPPRFLDEDGSELFLGIGSILWDHLPKVPRKIVAGSGWGGYTAPPNVHDGSWEVLWVRGPRTATRLGIDPELVITDAAVLLRRMPLPAASADVDAAFMPHVDSIERGDWEAVCRLANVTFLDPRAPVADLLAKIKGARVVVTEAMHGAIVADALRTPWIAVTPLRSIHQAKWLDWSESLNLDLRRHHPLISNAREAYISATGLRGRGRWSNALLDGSLIAPVSTALRHRAARALIRIADDVEPQLSSDLSIETVTSRCEEALASFVSRRGRTEATD